MTEENLSDQSNEKVNNEENDPKEVKEETSPTTETDPDPEIPATDSSYEPPKPVERKIKHPKTDVVRSPDSDLDMKWGWAIEFTSTEFLEPIWEKLKVFLETNPHPISAKIKWLSLDPRGYFSPRLRYFITITGWGMQIETISEWFSKNIGEIKKPSKIIEESEELAEDNWQGYIVKDTIELKGPKFLKLDSHSRNKRKLDIESKKPVSSSIPRYWAETPVFSVRDYLVPFITFEKHKEGSTTPESYLEEYIVEQLDWVDPENEQKYIILPEVFKSDPDHSRGITIPEEYTPEIDFSSMGGMFPGMGGIPGMGELGDMPDFSTDDLNNLDLEDNDSDNEDNLDPESDDSNPDVIDAEIIDDESNK
ncbi:MAG: hypothetical protein ACC656_08665, partial [Candidatus Heimdallarchaeota archaeon]